MKSPIVIFSYNRPYHLSNLIDTLIKNKVSKKSKIFFFCDGPKNNYDKTQIKKIKSILDKKNLKIEYKNFHKKNIGLKNNIINGVSFVLSKYGRCIVLEDDLVLNHHSLKFMDVMLDKFRENKAIGSVSAHSYIDGIKTKKKFDFYISKRHSSWCWGTWSRVWKNIDWDIKKLNSHFSDQSKLKKFSEGGNDLNLLLWGNYKKIINSWAIMFNYHCMHNSLKSIQPRFSMIRNDGRDASGTHEGISFNFSKKKISFNPRLGSQKYILKKTEQNSFIDFFIKNSHRKSLKLSIKFFFQNFKII